MEIWKTRPGLDATLMRTINYNYGRTHDENKIIMDVHLKQRYDYWRTTDEAQYWAAYAIQDIFITKQINIANAYKRLHFSKLNCIDYDLFTEICKDI